MDKTNLRKSLEQLEDDIHKSWLKDQDKVKEMHEIIEILEKILNGDTIEAFFEDESDYNYFTKKFSKEVINNILRQHFIFGPNGDDVALQIIVLYLKIFLKFMDKVQYVQLWESIKNIFDCSNAYYKAMMYGNMRIEAEQRNKKQMSNDHFNVINNII